MSWWVQALILGFVFYESLVVGIYNAVVKDFPQSLLWITLGSKIVKMLLSIIAFVAVKLLTDIPIKPFALTLVGIYLVSIIFETIYFLKKKPNNENNK